jgi:WD40 repeat protein
MGKLSELLRGELDWIVMKAIEKERVRRYATAIGLANDIQRYLSDQPVSACPPSAWYRFCKFTKRNRVLMVSMTAGILLLVVSAITSGLSARSSWISAQEAKFEQERATQAYKHVEQQRQRAVRAEQSALQRLFESKIGFARASVVSRRRGQQLATLQAMSEAADLLREMPQFNDKKLLLRNLVIAALATPDVGEPTVVAQLQRSEQHNALSPDFQRIASVDFKRKADLVIRPLHGRSGPSLRIPLESRTDRNYHLQFDGTGRFLAASSLKESKVWDLSDLRVAVHVSPCTMDAPHFSSDGKLVSIVEHGRGVHVFELPTGTRKQTIEDSALLSTTLMPDGSKILVERGGRGPIDRIVIGETERETYFPIPVKAGPSLVTTSPDGQLLASSQGGSIIVYVAESGTVLQQLRAHNSYAWYLQFNAADPNYLISASWDGTIKLWSVATGDCLMTLFARTPQFSQDGSRFAYHIGMDVAVADFVAASACKWLRGVRCNSSTISKDGNWLAAAFADGFGIWNLQTMEPSVWINAEPVYDVDFDPQTGDLWTCQDRGVFCWKFNQATGFENLTNESGRLLDHRLDRPIRQLAMSANGEQLIVDCHHSDEALVINRADQTQAPMRLACRYQMMVTISPGGELAALGTSHASDVHVFDLASGEKIRQLPASGWSTPTFSLDGKQLFAGGRTTLTNWSTDDWRPRYEMPANVTSGGALIGLSADKQLGAVFVESGELKLIRIQDGSELCTLTPPTNLTEVRSLCFAPDNKFLSASCGPGGLCIWNLETIQNRLAAYDLQWQPTPSEVP